jgi:hypothetical protein
MEFFNSSSQHQWVLEQEGSWIQGYHKGDFSTREIMGTLEGDQLRLQSVDQHPADHLPYIFTGTVSNDQLSGKVYMGEYLTAKFVAKRGTFKVPRRKFMVPGGPPLAT